MELKTKNNAIFFYKGVDPTELKTKNYNHILQRGCAYGA